MKISCALAVLMLASVVVSSAQTQTAKPLGIVPEQVQRVEILYFPERVPVRAALSPERLEQLYEYKLEIRDVRQTAEWERLAPLLQETSVKPVGRSYDHRTAVLLFDADGRRIASVYFDAFGRYGTMNGYSGAITSGMYKWAKSLLKGVTG